MNHITLVKLGANLFVGSGASIIVKGIISNNVVPANLTQKVLISGTSVVLGMMLSDAAGEYARDKIDDAYAWYKENVQTTN